MLHPKVHNELVVELRKLGPLSSLKDHLIVVKVGSEYQEASADDLYDITQSLKEILVGAPDLNIIITHHNVEFVVKPPGTQIVIPQSENPVAERNMF